MAGLWWLGRPGEEGRVLRGVGYEAEEEEVCLGGPGRLVFSGEPEQADLVALQGAVSANAARVGAALSGWRTVSLPGAIEAQEADWTRDGQRHVVRLVGPTPLDDDATACLFLMN
ncbi:hypothetical protein C8263_12320 [Deinococcus arcticus]|uniref:Uncharacterized protein n=1 Tax=Deinococcus arcticus TaxID=2136176 RepID=A0A2T3W6T4_9DEIO|nr:hypothetical protein C8263_12320 [Deinococcus arcticus]